MLDIPQVDLTSVQSAECERLSQVLGGGESALRVCAALLGAGPQASPMHPHHLPGTYYLCLFYYKLSTYFSFSH